MANNTRQVTFDSNTNYDKKLKLPRINKRQSSQARLRLSNRINKRRVSLNPSTDVSINDSYDNSTNQTTSTLTRTKPFTQTMDLSLDLTNILHKQVADLDDDDRTFSRRNSVSSSASTSMMLNLLPAKTLNKDGKTAEMTLDISEILQNYSTDTTSLKQSKIIDNLIQPNSRHNVLSLGNNKSSIASKYENIGKSSYREHFQQKFKRKLQPHRFSHNGSQSERREYDNNIDSRQYGIDSKTTCTDERNIRDKIWSGYNKYMYPSRLKQKVRDKLMNNRMANIVLYLSTLSHRSKHRQIIKRKFAQTVRAILFQTDLHQMEKRLNKFYHNQYLKQKKLLKSKFPSVYDKNDHNNDNLQPNNDDENQSKTIRNNMRKTNGAYLDARNSLLVYRRSVSNNYRLRKLVYEDEVEPAKLETIKNWLIMHMNESNVFKLFNENDLRNILNKIRIKVIKYTAGQTIYSEQDESKYFYTVLHGSVAIWAKKYQSYEIPSDPKFKGYQQIDDPFSHPTLQNINKKGSKYMIYQQKHTRAMTMFQQCFAKCGTRGLANTFGELSFENENLKHQSIAIASETSFIAAIHKDDYFKYFQSKVIKSHAQTIQLFKHFATNKGYPFSLERCCLLKDLSKIKVLNIPELIVPSRVNGVNNIKVNKLNQFDQLNKFKDHFSDISENKIYIIAEGSVAAYIGSSGVMNKSKKSRRKSNVVHQLQQKWKQKPLLTLGRGELVDPRNIIKKGCEYRKISEENLFDSSIYNDLYFVANSAVVLYEINIQTLFRISNFHFWSVFNASKRIIEFALNKHVINMEQQQSEQLKKMQLGNINGGRVNSVQSRLQALRWKKNKLLENNMPELMPNDGYIDMFVNLEKIKQEESSDDVKDKDKSMDSCDNESDGENDGYSMVLEEIVKWRTRVPTMNAPLPKPLRVINV